MVKGVADVTSAAHAKTITMCASKGVMPTCGTRIVPNSGIADVAGAGAIAPTAGGQAEVTDMRIVGSSARIDCQRSSSKRTASDHSSGFCIRGKRRAGCGGDHADPGPIPAQHILPCLSDAMQQSTWSMLPDCGPAESAI